MHYANFNITQDQIENLIIQGESAAENQLNHIVKFANKSIIDEIGNFTEEDNPEDIESSNAAKLADKMISGLKMKLLIGIKFL